MLEGLIVRNISNSYTVLCGCEKYECTPRGKFRNIGITPLVGDHCIIDKENKYILELLPRKNELKRPNVCNVDICLIVTSLKEPDYNSTLLDKQISTVILSNIEPVLCFTKLDLLNNEEYEQFKYIREYYEKIGIMTFDNHDIEPILKFLKNKIVVLTGQSGAGKSSLLNKIAPSLKLQTNEISAALNRGKHTTRHTEIFQIQDVLFFDTPGFSSLNLEEKTKEEIKSSFIEFKDYDCQFRDCMHLKEVNCGVKNALKEQEIMESRYQSYLKELEEAKK